MKQLKHNRWITTLIGVMVTIGLLSFTISCEAASDKPTPTPNSVEIVVE
jgi:hypothetical protein